VGIGPTRRRGAGEDFELNGLWFGSPYHNCFVLSLKISFILFLKYVLLTNFITDLGCQQNSNGFSILNFSNRTIFGQVMIENMDFVPEDLLILCSRTGSANAKSKGPPTQNAVYHNLAKNGPI